MLLATHLAETSVTIDDVVYVIDSGRFKVLFPSVARMNFGRNRVNVFTRNDGAVKVNPGIFTTCIPPKYSPRWTVFYEMVQSNAIFLLDVTEVTTLALWRIGGPIELPFDKKSVAKRLRSWARTKLYWRETNK